MFLPHRFFCVQHRDPEAEGGDHRTQEVHRPAQEGEGRVRQLHAAGGMQITSLHIL